MNPNEPTMLSGDQFSEFLEKLPEGAVVRIDNDPNATDRYLLKRETFESLEQMSRGTDKFHLVCLAMRPGAAEFINQIELRFYNPLDPEINVMFESRWVKWNSVLFTITSVPIMHKTIFEGMAARSGFTIADGVPVMLGEGTCGRNSVELAPGVVGSGFPLNGPCVFTLEGTGRR